MRKRVISELAVTAVAGREPGCVRVALHVVWMGPGRRLGRQRHADPRPSNHDGHCEILDRNARHCRPVALAQVFFIHSYNTLLA